MSSRVIGVLGGMGPAATIDFMAEVLRLTGARREQDNVRLIVDSNPTLPDRHAAIAGSGPSPGPALAEMARGLQRAGAEALVMPCNTAHAFADEIRAATPLPFIDMIAATVETVAAAHPLCRRVGVLAAAGCLDARLYETALTGAGLDALTPRGEQRTRFMELVWKIKAGDVGAEVRDCMASVAVELVAGGAEVLIAGCTEVPLVLGADDLDAPLISSTEVLARRTIDWAFQTGVFA